jgi:hypothetical protein
MLRDNLVELIEPMRNRAGAVLLALGIYQQKPASDDSLSCLENPRPEGAESSLTDNVTSPFPAEPRHGPSVARCKIVDIYVNLFLLQCHTGQITSAPKLHDFSARGMSRTKTEVNSSSHQFRWHPRITTNVFTEYLTTFILFL